MVVYLAYARLGTPPEARGARSSTSSPLLACSPRDARGRVPLVDDVAGGLERFSGGGFALRRCRPTLSRRRPAWGWPPPLARLPATAGAAPLTRRGRGLRGLLPSLFQPLLGRHPGRSSSLKTDSPANGAHAARRLWVRPTRLGTLRSHVGQVFALQASPAVHLRCTACFSYRETAFRPCRLLLHFQ